jgi:hypothetical protein
VYDDGNGSSGGVFSDGRISWEINSWCLGTCQLSAALGEEYTGDNKLFVRCWHNIELIK